MASDLSQLAINPSAGAVNRRLDGLLNSTQTQQAVPVQAQSPIAPVNGIDTAGARPPTMTLPGVQVEHAQAAPPPNPLIGGTGNAGLDKYLGTDSTYQSQLSQLMKQLDDYNAQRNLQASQTQADYDAKIKALNTQTAQDQLNMRNAAAARGILQSGIYANQLGQYNDANQQQMTNLLGGLQNAKDTANLAYTQEVDQLEAAKQNAIQQAAARRAASLGTF